MVLLLFLLVPQCFTLALFLSPKPVFVTTLETPGPAKATTTTTSTYICNDIDAPASTVFTALTTCRRWAEWISPGALIQSNKPQLAMTGDTFTEVFGPGKSSLITWEVTDMSAAPTAPSTVALTSKATVGTVGWDRIDIFFDVGSQLPASSKSTLIMRYTWAVSNPLVAFIERTFMRNGMVKDNCDAIKRLVALVEQEHAMQTPL